MKDRARDIVNKMYELDDFSQWLGIEIIHIEAGKAELKMTVRDEMTNGFNIAHGGITFSFADSALAFACNGQGRHAVSIETAISHQEAVHPGDVLIAKAREIKKTNRIGWYDVSITNQNENIVASFKGTVYRTSKEWEV